MQLSAHLLQQSRMKNVRTTQVSPFIQYHDPTRIVCSLHLNQLHIDWEHGFFIKRMTHLLLHHICVTATKLGPTLASKAPSTNLAANSERKLPSQVIHVKVIPQPSTMILVNVPMGSLTSAHATGSCMNSCARKTMLPSHEN